MGGKRRSEEKEGRGGGKRRREEEEGRGGGKRRPVVWVKGTENLVTRKHQSPGRMHTIFIIDNSRPNTAQVE